MGWGAWRRWSAGRPYVSRLSRQQNTAAGQPAGSAFLIGAPARQLWVRVFLGPRPLLQAPDLVVVLHGDAPRHKPSYHYQFTQDLAARAPGVIVAGLLRPGYEDGLGGRSRGWRGMATGDNYTADRIDAVAASVRALAHRVEARSLALIGHSGGAAIAALLLGRAPDLAASALLVSCPCDVTAWRRHMAARSWLPFWLLPTASLSPIELSHRVVADRVWLVVGGNDQITPPCLSAAYAKALPGCRDARLHVLPGLGHEILADGAAVGIATAFLRPRSIAPGQWPDGDDGHHDCRVGPST